MLSSRYLFSWWRLPTMQTNGFRCENGSHTPGKSFLWSLGLTFTFRIQGPTSSCNLHLLSYNVSADTNPLRKSSPPLSKETVFAMAFPPPLTGGFLLPWTRVPLVRRVVPALLRQWQCQRRPLIDAWSIRHRSEDVPVCVYRSNRLQKGTKE